MIISIGGISGIVSVIVFTVSTVIVSLIRIVAIPSSIVSHHEPAILSIPSTMSIPLLLPYPQTVISLPPVSVISL